MDNGYVDVAVLEIIIITGMLKQVLKLLCLEFTNINIVLRE